MISCDRCSAHAYVFIRLRTGGTLAFCNHHWVQHKDALTPRISTLINQAYKLQES